LVQCEEKTCNELDLSRDNETAVINDFLSWFVEKGGTYSPKIGSDDHKIVETAVYRLGRTWS